MPALCTAFCYSLILFQGLQTGQTGQIDTRASPVNPLLCGPGSGDVAGEQRGQVGKEIHLGFGIKSGPAESTPFPSSIFSVAAGQGERGGEGGSRGLAALMNCKVLRFTSRRPPSNQQKGACLRGRMPLQAANSLQGACSAAARLRPDQCFRDCSPASAGQSAVWYWPGSEWLPRPLPEFPVPSYWWLLRRSRYHGYELWL